MIFDGLNTRNFKAAVVTNETTDEDNLHQTSPSKDFNTGSADFLATDSPEALSAKGILPIKQTSLIESSENSIYGLTNKELEIRGNRKAIIIKSPQDTNRDRQNRDIFSV